MHRGVDSAGEDVERVAVVDIGTNSTRLLIADVGDSSGERPEGPAGGGAPGRSGGSRVAEVERRTRVTRLGRGVDLTGQLSGEAIEAVCETIAEYIALCEEADVGAVTAIATSAVRDAHNGGAFIAELRERFALSAQLLDGEEEARLTYLGATAERRPEEPTLVIDIGGGSTELIVGSGADVAFHTSLQVGVVRHTERHISSDPPAMPELESLAGDVRGAVKGALAGNSKAEAQAGIAVAGTPTSLAAIEMALEPYDASRVHGHVLSLASVQQTLSRLAAVPLSERSQIPGLHPDRAPTIVAGVVILVESMRAFGLDQIDVSEHDILYGAAISTIDREKGR